MTDCVFCPTNWPNLDIVSYGFDPVIVINPLDPVTPGHVLVIHRNHTENAATDPQITAELMRSAAWYVNHHGIEANIITSIGRNATQTILHTHVHVVPRRPNDGLPLPWTPQHEAKTVLKGTHGKYSRRGQGWPPAEEQEAFERQFHERQGWLGDGGPLCGQGDS